MLSDRHQALKSRAQGVKEVLVRLDPKVLLQKPNSFEPTIGESVARSLLELDRIAFQARVVSGTLPVFASDFLNRRLSRQLLLRYRGPELAAEFERRLDEVLRSINRGPAGDTAGHALDNLDRLLTELEATLVQRQGSVERSSKR